MYTIEQITKAVNHWAMTDVCPAQVNYFLKSLTKVEDCPPFNHDDKLKIIFLKAEDIVKFKIELDEWRKKSWVVQSIFEY